MSKQSNIQWCDGTINPVMGCGGCELFPGPGEIVTEIDATLRETGFREWNPGQARQMFKELVRQAWHALPVANGESHRGYTNAVTTTNIYHLRNEFQERVTAQLGRNAGRLVITVIESKVTCYAAKLHLNRSTNIISPGRKANRGYAPTFEQVTQFPGRLRNASRWPDLRGQRRADKPWLDMLPRLIFVSDMGDALSRKKEFLFLSQEMEAVTSEDGRRHLWLWLTKRPRTMQQFADSIGGLPENVCAMTTVASHETLDRVDELRAVNARVRGLSLEPLWSNIADRLDLTGIDWVIVGGESGSKKIVRPFPVEWAVALRDLCREQGVAFFLKQLGRQPTRNGEEFSLNHGHGGDQEEWDEALRIREFPEYFHNYRQPAEVLASR